MNIAEVLLTEDEICVVCEECPKPICEMASKDEMCEKHLKAQCLKLLEWLKMPCEEHDHRTLCDPDGYCLTKDCSWCMSELESKLKGGM